MVQLLVHTCSEQLCVRQVNPLNLPFPTFPLWMGQRLNSTVCSFAGLHSLQRPQEGKAKIQAIFLHRTSSVSGETLLFDAVWVIYAMHFVP